MESLYDKFYDYDDYAPPKAVVFPAPPPTTNALSSAERARLLRSSKKIARVLGVTPRFVDSQFEDTIESSSSCSTTFTSTSHTSTSTSATSMLTLHSVGCKQKPWPLTSWQDAWPGRKPLKLKLALETSLESIPASPLTPTMIPVPIPTATSRSTPTRHKRSAPLDGSPSSSPCRGVSPEPNSPGSSPPIPSFMIPSRTAARRRKLDRLRRTLGEDVPVRLVFPQTEESDSESGSEPSLSSYGKTSSEDDLIMPDFSPLSPTRLLLNVHITKPEDKPIPHPPQRIPRKKKITNTRDSLALPSKPTRIIKVPRATRPAPPPPIPSSSPNKTASSKATTQYKPHVPSEAPGAKPTTLLRTYEHPPIVHRRSNSGSSSNASIRLGLGVILEEKGESEWYESDDEDEEGPEFIKEDEVLGVVGGWGCGRPFLYGGAVGKGMSRGLAKSYANGSYSGA
ncbi:hypothetical protein C0989_001356 [Termitomyces sp. Mn162]|nr:hypothetical protein C0989_001356 [Termitomyces sp. Mn162]